MKVFGIVLAAGKGTRMRSEEPKCAHYIIDKTMVEYVVDSLKGARIQDIITVVGYRHEVIEEILGDRSRYALQEQQLGTAHAVMMAEPFLKDEEGLTLIAIGDMPLVSKETYASLIGFHLQSGSDLTVLTTEHPTPYGYGRVVRDEADEIVEIVEEKDCDEIQKNITEINSSIYVADNQKLFKYIHFIKNNNSQKEYYLTDIVKVFKEHGLSVRAHKTNNYREISGVNDKVQLMIMENELIEKINRRHLQNGVTIHSPQTVVIGMDVKCRPGSVINTGSIIIQNSIIEKGAIIGPYSEIKNSIIDEGARVKYSKIKDSHIKVNSRVGPYVNMIRNAIVPGDYHY
ncbi:MAG TPA: NTP transferase domain-containing protein [Bacilli bacterium]|nr:MAG: Bifunctional protein GlmU [Tenericutes bacterium ADurb.BinA124]HNZ50073.1 NTP transferase domain-containing protein [Bacilli bacterium]HOH18042.1 NTP transferase domain-containing protein [Bacilli bacterium]HPX84824.1 NTP transferase domain-containing protein [Bacilli bacterium]HQC74662.1 NTP transferase domain-containing protein [Bacilli bacterium]